MGTSLAAVAPSILRLAPGVRLFHRCDRRFATVHARVVLSRHIDDAAAATAVLARTIESATARTPTREGLAHRLADLYGAELAVDIERVGAAAPLVASLDWPIRGIPHARRALSRGLDLLGEVVADPVRQGDLLDATLVERALDEVRRDLLRQRDDHARAIARLAVELAAPDRPLSRPTLGTEAEVAKVDAGAVTVAHARLLARAPIDIVIVGDVAKEEVVRSLRGSILVRRARGAGSKKTARRAADPTRRVRRPRAFVEHIERRHVAQSWWATAWRLPRTPVASAADAGKALSGVLGESGASLLFQGARERDGLAYEVGSRWFRDPGLLLVHAGHDDAAARRLARVVDALIADLGAHGPDRAHLDAWKQEERDRLLGLADEPAALARWWCTAAAQGESLTLDSAVARRLAVTRDAVRAVARRLVPIARARIRAARGRAS